MTIHLIKLCVGPDSVDELASRQKLRLKKVKQIFHVTRMYPRRAEELVQDGSIYWVIKGVVQARQRIIDIQKFRDSDGIRRCKLIFDPELVHVEFQPRRAFQGWRYLEPDDAPADVMSRPEDDILPPGLRRELMELCLI